MKLFIQTLDNGFTLSVTVGEGGDERKTRFAFETREALDRSITSYLDAAAVNREISMENPVA